ncbi:MAG TPA: polyphosphate kinase 1 [Clostridiales bacterium UBA8960]|nr:polyphosphate kinase 1 [Clostridiales bacterium UBA8960]
MLFNRELSWLEFNRRVLMEMEDEHAPLLERLKFSAIFSSNLDEFYMVRVAAIKNQISSGYEAVDPSGLTATEKLIQINQKVRDLVSIQYKMTTDLLKQLDKNGMRIIRKDQFSSDMTEQLERKFNLEIFPVLTPMAVDYTRRFPLISNKTLYIGVKLLIGLEQKLALVQVPIVLDRLIKVENCNSEACYVLLEDVIETFIDKLFLGHQVLATSKFRATRNGDLNIVEDEAEDLLMVIEEAVKLRKWGETVRLELSDCEDTWLQKVLQDSLMLETQQVLKIDGILDLTFLFKLKAPKTVSHLTKTIYKPKKVPVVDKKNIFKSIRENDIFVHHPYESFDIVADFIKLSSRDPNVLAIKQTLYRVSGDSQIVKALAEAAERGKQVTVLVELRARFDEENNINWAKKLEQRGVHVIYGILGLKTHSKITLVVRREKNKIRRYLHLGTGNYNDQTAKVYTDMGIFTCKENFGADASVFFNMISGFVTSVNTNIMSVAPFTMRQKFQDLIDREIKHAKSGHPARIFAKMNSLVDIELIDKLYEASSAGVKIDLIVRGICTLVPGMPEMSENISVTSIVGEFLEHSRIYYFENRKNPEIYLSSADWMTRNLSRRVELLFPIEDPVIAERILLTLKLYFADNQKSWRLGQDGLYVKKSANKKPIHAQDVLKSITYTTNKEYNDKMKAIIERE